MNISDYDSIFDQYFDQQFLTKTLSELAQIPTEVPLGYDTFMDPDHPKLVYYVQDIMKPRINGLGYHEIIDAPLNNLIVEIGEGKSDRTLLIQNYTVTQHYNLMEDPFSGKIASAKEFGFDEQCVFGQGVSQNKSHQAVMLALLKLIRDSGIKLPGKLFWTVNSEGNSSHECSIAILGALPRKPNFGILQINTGLKLWLGNRGRVDVNVHVKGRATHSSSPDLGLSAIDGVNKVINCLKSLTWSDNHELLGSRHAIVYKIKYEPLAPHTLPSDAYLAIDRRLLPGDSVDTAIQEIKDVLSSIDKYDIEVTTGYVMVPAMVDTELNEVKLMEECYKSVKGNDIDEVYGGGAFDAGGLCERGIPTVMFGCAGGDGLLGTDFIPISAVIDEARILFNFICKMIGST